MTVLDWERLLLITSSLKQGGGDGKGVRRGGGVVGSSFPALLFRAAWFE